MRKSVLFFLALIFALTISKAQTITYSDDVACILNTHCFRCHNTVLSLAAISFTNYHDAWSERNSIKYYVESKQMPPYSPTTENRSYSHEKTLTQSEIDLIVAWVNQGTTQGGFIPPTPVFAPLSPQISTPDISYRIPAYTVPNFVGFQYHCFVVPTTFNTEKKISQVEILPTDLSAVYSVFLYSDTSNISLALDAADISNGYENYSGIGSSTAKLLYGWVNGNPLYHTPPNAALRLDANAHLVMRILFAEDALGKTDSTALNIKFDSTATRIIDVATLLNHNSNLQNPPFVIPADSVKTFYEQYTVPADVSLLSVSHWAQKFCASMNCFAVTPANDTIPLLQIEDHEDLWSQGVYYFDKPLKIPTGSVIYGESVYDNTSSNPNNPFFPSHNIVAGNADTTEQMLFSFSFLPYQSGDENIIADSIIHQQHYLNCSPAHAVGIAEINSSNNFSVYPNPTTDFLNISSINQESFSTTVFNALGEKIYSAVSTSNLKLETASFPNGLYFVQIKTDTKYFTQKFIKQ